MRLEPFVEQGGGMRSTRALTAAVLLVPLVADRPLSQTPNPDKNAYSGETHVHTSWSLDACPLQ